MDENNDLKEKTGYVIMLDVLGFRDSVSKYGNKSFFNAWSELKRSLNEKRERLESEPSIDVSIDVLCLSDTLIICVSYKDGSEDDPRYILANVPGILNVFFWKFMRDKKIFFRGAISYGQFTFSHSLSVVMGEALDEVSRWYESTDWIGIILTPSARYALEYIDEVNSAIYVDYLSLIHRRFVPYSDIPFKPGYPKTCKYAYYWFKHDGDFDTYKTNIKKILKVFSSVKHEPEYAAKYSNTVEFFRKLKPKPKVRAAKTSSSS